MLFSFGFILFLHSVLCLSLGHKLLIFFLVSTFFCGHGLGI